MPSATTLTLNPAIDKNSRVDHVVPEKKLRCSEPTYEPGGGGINVARALRKLGSAGTAWYLAGGPPGELLRNLLEEEELDHRPIEIEAWTRENLIVFEETTSRQYRFGMPGAAVSEEEFHGVLERFRAQDPFPDYVAASGSLAPGLDSDAYARVADLVAERGGRLIADTSGAPLRELAKAPVFLLKPNLGELADLTGGPIRDEQDLRDRIHKLLGEGMISALLVSMGAAGGLLATEEGLVRIPAPTVPIASKVGAGDSMVAGLLHGLLRGDPLSDAARFGVAAGTAAVTTPGTELCRREDTERLYRQIQGTPIET